MSKFFILEARQLKLPSKCVSCGASGLNDGRKFIDFGYDIDYYGAVYFCELCFVEICKQLGWISKKESVELEEEYMLTKARMKTLEDEVIAYRNILDGVDFLHLSNTDSSTNDKEVFGNSSTKSAANEKSVGQNTKPGSSNISDSKSDSNDGDSNSDPDLKIEL